MSEHSSAEVDSDSMPDSEVTFANTSQVIANQNKRVEITYHEHRRKFLFTKYNGMRVLYHVKSGYFNATKLCHWCRKDYIKLSRNHWYKDLLNYGSKLLEKPNSSLACNSVPLYNNAMTFAITKGYTDKICGTYVHPCMINFVCLWADLAYAFNVSAIMYAHDKATTVVIQETEEYYEGVIVDDDESTIFKDIRQPRTKSKANITIETYEE